MSMNLVPGSQRLTADGVVGTSGNPIRVFHIHLNSGATASTTLFRNGTGTGDTEYIQVDGLSSKSVNVGFTGGLRFPAGCYMDTDANIDYCTVCYTEEF